MRLRTDDDIYRARLVYLGPPGYTLPIHLPYAQYGMFVLLVPLFVFLHYLITFEIDAFPAWEPITTRVIEEGVAYPLVRIWDPEEHRKLIGEKALALTLATREDVIKEKPDLVRRVVNAHRKGLQFIRTRPTADLVEVVLKNPRTAEQFKGLDRPLIAKMLDRVKPGFGDGCLSRSGFATEMELAIEYKLVKRAITFEEFADPTFAGACP